LYIGKSYIGLYASSNAGSKHITGYHCASTHSEINALKGVPFDYLKNPRKAKNIRLVNYRLTMTYSPITGKIVSVTLSDSAPCSHCLHTLISKGIKKITYSTSDNNMVTKKLIDMFISGETHVSSGYKGLKRKGNIVTSGLRADKRHGLKKKLSPKSGKFIIDLENKKDRTKITRSLTPTEKKKKNKLLQIKRRNSF